MKIKIGSSFYDVVFEDIEEWGKIIPQEGKIVINKNIHQQDKFSTLIHEILHLLLLESNIEDFIKKKHKEDFVEVLSTWLCIFLIDNDIYEIMKDLDIPHFEK